MPTGLSKFLRQLQAELTREAAAVTDGQLLERFLTSRDGDAFALLVRRHGPMVLGVCRRLLGHEQDAEDAFQATFLVAVRRAGSVRPREQFGNFLYGVAYRTALEARARAGRRRAREKQVEDMPHPQQPEPETVWRELRPLLDRELSRLPDKYRVPVVLCDLEGRSRREVARQLALPEGTLSSRLATARRTLARRLARYGPALSGGALAAALAGNASAGVPPLLALATARVAALAGGGPAVLAAFTSAEVAALTEGVLKAMTLTKMKLGGLVLAAVLVAAAGVTGRGAVLLHPLADDGAGGLRADDQRADPPRAPDPARPAGRSGDVIRGSGNVVTKELKLTEFTGVEVGGIFHVTITQADAFRVAVTADDNVQPYVKVVKDGSTLKIGLEGRGGLLNNVTLKVAVALPTLEGVHAEGVSQVKLEGIKSGKDCKLRVKGASNLSGELQAGNVDVEVTEASQLKLKGSARKARLVGDGAAQLTLEDFSVETASVTLNGAAQASVRVKDELDYDLNGAAHLRYHGNPKIGKQKQTGAASVSSK